MDLTLVASLYALMAFAQTNGLDIIEFLHGHSAKRAARRLMYAESSAVKPDAPLKELCASYEAAHYDTSSDILHVGGMLAALILVALCLTRPRYWRMLLYVPPCYYIPAWLGHFFIQRDIPAVFSYGITVRGLAAGEYCAWAALVSGRVLSSGSDFVQASGVGLLLLAVIRQSNSRVHRQSSLLVPLGAVAVVLFLLLGTPVRAFSEQLSGRSAVRHNAQFAFSRNIPSLNVSHNAFLGDTTSVLLRKRSRLHAATLPTEENHADVSKSASVAQWHRNRRREMLCKYGDQIAPLEQSASSQDLGIPLLLLTCTSLLTLAIVSGSQPWPMVVALALFPGSMFSLWQLQLLHDVIHGSFFKKGKASLWGIPRKELQDKVLFWGSMPSIFGYYLYLKVGHLTHHKNTGEYSLADLFESNRSDFEDGDVLFVAHRMHVKGDYGPKLTIPYMDKELKMSISKSGFYFWSEGEEILNAMRFIASFMYERVLLSCNDVLVCFLGKNLFFPNKPQEFQDSCTAYARAATAVRIGLLLSVGWKSLLFLYLSESLWSIPPHPACAMFVSNHGSSQSEDGACVPTSSTYAGPLYSLFTLGTNFHCEHHDFPTIPFQKLHELRKIAPEYYRSGSDDNLMGIMSKTFAYPEFYACQDANTHGLGTYEHKDSPEINYE